MTLRIGYKVSAEQFAPRELVEVGVAAEQAGMESASVSDHFQPWRHEGGHAPFALAWLAAVGERTEAITLLSLTPEQKHSIEDPVEMERFADQLPIEQVVQRWIVASDPAEAVEQVRPYVAAGFDHLVLHAPGHDQRRFLAQYAEDLADPLHALATELPS